MAATENILEQEPVHIERRAESIGSARLDRSNFEILITAVIGGGEVSLGALAAMTVLGAILSISSAIGLYPALAIAGLAFPIGFMFVIMGRSELFTENFLIPVVSVFKTERTLGSLAQLWVAHITFCVSYVAVVVRARAANMDPRLEEAARDLGASALGAFRYVTLPLIAPAVLAGALLAFSLSFDDYVVTTFNSGVGSSTLPLYIYGRIKFGVTPEINAISTIIVAITAIAILVAWRAGAFDPGRRRPVAEEPSG